MANKKPDFIPKLGNPNDDSHDQCHAPVENGKVIKEKKKHFKDGKDIPKGWVEVPCDIGCHLTKQTLGEIKMNSWINSKEELPKENGRYLASCGSVFIAKYTASNKTWKCEDSQTGLNQVWYWMDLPEPPTSK
jgi:hypothetical protein